MRVPTIDQYEAKGDVAEGRRHLFTIRFGPDTGVSCYGATEQDARGKVGAFLKTEFERDQKRQTRQTKAQAAKKIIALIGDYGG